MFSLDGWMVSGYSWRQRGRNCHSRFEKRRRQRVSCGEPTAAVKISDKRASEGNVPQLFHNQRWINVPCLNPCASSSLPSLPSVFLSQSNAPRGSPGSLWLLLRLTPVLESS